MEHILIGIFLLIIGLAMAFMSFIYFKTRKMNLSWSIFGILYAIGLLVLFTNNPIKDSLKITSTDNIFSISSFIILVIGIMLSYGLFARKGDNYIIAGILLSVGIHFIPFHSIATSILSILLILNALIAFVKKDLSIMKTLAIDSFIKITLGIILCFY